MAIGAFIEPLVVVSLLVGGTLINRQRQAPASSPVWASHKRNDSTVSSLESGQCTPKTDGDIRLTSNGDDVEKMSGAYLTSASDDAWRTRKPIVLSWQSEIRRTDSRQFADRFLSRVLQRFPFLLEVWYWALIYWVYQLGRAFTAVTLVEGTVHTARRHALQLIRFEKYIGLFWEPEIQRYFLQYPTLMMWINRIYSFIHIPGTILFLIWLFFITITANMQALPTSRGSPAGPALYAKRRRTMAMCNLIAFVVFTIWPCMPPRLLSEPHKGQEVDGTRTFGFVDTVHGEYGAKSVWTANRFCNQYAAMPSLHFGYSLLIGLTIALIPLPSTNKQSKSYRLRRLKLRMPSLRRLVCVTLGFAYPTIILVAIVATANHFILDAVAGAIVCGVAWNSEELLLKLLPLEDLFLRCLRISKPDLELDRGAMSDEALSP